MGTELLSQVRIVMVRTYHPGNIGSAARAMKTMGLEHLTLVNPVDFPSPQAETMAAGASDILTSLELKPSVMEAVGDCAMVVACSARSREYDLPMLTARECAQAFKNAARTSPVALMFGPERHGLSNEDMNLATHRVCIDANPEYSSLNLASAIQILSYELRQACLVPEIHSSASAMKQRPSASTINHYFERLDKLYRETGFVNQAHPGELQRKLRHLYARAAIDQQELNILQGMLSSIESYLKRD